MSKRQKRQRAKWARQKLKRRDARCCKRKKRYLLIEDAQVEASRLEQSLRVKMTTYLCKNCSSIHIAKSAEAADAAG